MIQFKRVIVGLISFEINNEDFFKYFIGQDEIYDCSHHANSKLVHYSAEIIRNSKNSIFIFKQKELFMELVIVW